jgi:septum formation protein
MSLWRAAEPLVLASKSVVRRVILEQAGLPVEPRVAALDERAIETDAGPRDPGAVAALLARAKAAAIAAKSPGRVVLGADQTLALGEQRFSKPEGRDAARRQLRELRGRTHSLHTAIALMRDDAVIFEHIDVAYLTMRPFSDRFREVYLDQAGETVALSVGAYQLEGPGVHLFERIAGDYFTILGLPLLPLLGALRREGLVED